MITGLFLIVAFLGIVFEFCMPGINPWLLIPCSMTTGVCLSELNKNPKGRWCTFLWFLGYIILLTLCVSITFEVLYGKVFQ